VFARRRLCGVERDTFVRKRDGLTRACARAPDTPGSCESPLDEHFVGELRRSGVVQCFLSSPCPRLATWRRAFRSNMFLPWRRRHRRPARNATGPRRTRRSAGRPPGRHGRRAGGAPGLPRSLPGDAAAAGSRADPRLLRDGPAAQRGSAPRAGRAAQPFPECARDPRLPDPRHARGVRALVLRGSISSPCCRVSLPHIARRGSIR
jgi:hypothetical protein